MPDNYKEKNNTDISQSNEQFINQIQSLIGKNPNSLELSIFELCWNNKKLHESATYDTEVQKYYSDSIDLTPEISCILKTESSTLNENRDGLNDSANLITRLTNNTLKHFAKPVAFINSYALGRIQPKSTKETLSNIINGTSLVSNALGIPTLKAEIFFSNNHKKDCQIHAVSIGIIESRQIIQNQNQLKSGSKIYLLGKSNLFEIISNTAEKKFNQEDKNYSLSANYQKELHDALIQIIQSNSIKKMESIDEDGLLICLLKLVNNEQIGLKVDISAIKSISKDINDLNWISLSFESSVILISDEETELIKTAKDWDIDCLEIGELIADNQLIIVNKKTKLSKIPIAAILRGETDIQPSNTQKEKTEKKNELNLKQIALPKKLREVAWFLIKHPNIASKQCIFEQYDSMVGTANLSSNFSTAARIFNLKGTNKAIALGLYNNSAVIDSYPEIGIQIAIATLSRQMACSGAIPKGITLSLNTSINCDTDTYNKITKLYTGLEVAAKKYKINYSIEKFEHNNLNACSLNANVAMLGLIEDKNHQMTISFKNKGNIIFLIGQSKEDINCSEYLNSYHNINENHIPEFSLETEYKTQVAMQELISKNYVCSANNVSKGGLFISLVESAMVFGFGFDIITDTDIRTDAFLFGELQGRMLVSITPNKEDKFIDFMMKKEIPFLALGHVTKGEMRVDDISFGFIEDAKRAYETSFKELINN